MYKYLNFVSYCESKHLIYLLPLPKGRVWKGGKTVWTTTKSTMRIPQTINPLTGQNLQKIATTTLPTAQTTTRKKTNNQEKSRKRDACGIFLSRCYSLSDTVMPASEKNFLVESSHALSSVLSIANCFCAVAVVKVTVSFS